MDSLQDGTTKEAFKVGEGLSSGLPDFQTKVHPVHRSQSVNSVHVQRSKGRQEYESAHGALYLCSYPTLQLLLHHPGLQTTPNDV